MRWAALVLLVLGCSKQGAGMACPDGAEPRERRYPKGHMTWCAFEDGTRHGPLRVVMHGQTSIEGQCAYGQPDGLWIDYVSERTTLEVPFQRGLVHGQVVDRLSGRVVARCERGQKIEGPYDCGGSRPAQLCAGK